VSILTRVRRLEGSRGHMTLAGLMRYVRGEGPPVCGCAACSRLIAELVERARLWRAAREGEGA
jgi:hypothetical protein